MNYLKNFKLFENYSEGQHLVAKRDYLDLFKAGEKYQIYKTENNLGDDMYYLSHNGRNISGWGLKDYEIKLHFDEV